MEIPKEDVAEINELRSVEQRQLVEELILQLHEIGAVKLGNFKLKSGVMSPIYVDLRVLPSHPRVLERVVDSMWRCLTASVGEQEARKRFTHVCGVPYGALPFAAAIAIKHQVPMVICRKEAKDYGTKSLVEGVFKKDEKVLILEDVITSGISIQETSTNLRSAGLTVEEAVVFLDRQQGGRQRLAALEGGLAVTVHAVTSLRQMLETLKAHGRIEDSLLDSINAYLASMAQVSPAAAATTAAAAEKPKVLAFAERVDKCQSAVGKKLLRLMEQKKSNLSVAADVTSKSELLTLADKLGPHICMLKTHADIVRDWDANTGKELKELADKHHFLLFEDRKFADIGYVAQQQYGGGPFGICDWADVVTVHLVAGASVVTSLKETAAQKGQERGALLIAQMSTADAASKQEEGSVERALAAARAHTDFVVGFICQENVLAKNPEESASFLYCTPGVRIGSQGDGLGQTYRTPEMVIDPVAAAREYQEKAWAAYTARCSASQ
ncbi:orotidine 5'phosphate decarboxylase [Acanthamoeba castellanii str. Neff]|uniref:Uridine 5'-monophosphate synthase n=1 Tax=Acanthamoeba castellanii (strain ATCC 30010 / Neff) TaxID=1257118 RepID=L8H501_ACACF|nr:orotidine 5'phosphate decarboxylase [Acanthamoeba castellanii str. Neff]ELR19526.1 orotidine 5'phosphate decarboxylase [Acanthamoeba castellanii str. Neff]